MSETYGIGVRHCQLVLHFLFYLVVYGIQLALVVSLPLARSSEEENFLNELSFAEISFAISAYLVGFLITELFGGLLCKKSGYKWPMVILMVVLSVVTLNLPWVSSTYGFAWLYTFRVLQGLCVGLLFTMPADSINKWFTVQERTVAANTIYSSGKLGETLALLFTSVVASGGLSWTFLFSQYGYLAIIWAVLMALFGADLPETHPGISPAELKYITENRGGVDPKSKKLPLGSMLKSSALWAVVVAEIGVAWTTFFISANIPIYLRYFFEVNHSNNLYVIAQLASWVASFVFAFLAQHLIKKEVTTIGESRKLFNTIGCLVPLFIFIILLIFPTGSEGVGVAIYVILFVGSAATISGSKVNVNDIGPNVAPMVLGISSWVGQIFCTILNPVLGLLNLRGWNWLFLISILIILITNAFYLKFGSGEEQDWDDGYEDVEGLDEDDRRLSSSTSYLTHQTSECRLFIKKK